MAGFPAGYCCGIHHFHHCLPAAIQFRNFRFQPCDRISTCCYYGTILPCIMDSFSPSLRYDKAYHSSWHFLCISVNYTFIFRIIDSDPVSKSIRMAALPANTSINPDHPFCIGYRFFIRSQNQHQNAVPSDNQLLYQEEKGIDLWSRSNGCYCETCAVKWYQRGLSYCRIPG